MGLDILTLFQRRRGIAGRDIGDGGGGYIHVEDLAAAYVLALELLLAGGRSDYSTAATAGATPSWK